MNTRAARSAKRTGSTRLLSTSLVKSSSAPQAHDSGNGLETGAGNPVFADAARRQALIERTAYFRAKGRGVEPGHELDDWLEAEREIDMRLFRGESPAL